MKNKYIKKILNYYKESFRYLKDSRKFIFAIIFIFLLFSFIGFFVPANTQIQEAIMKFIQEILEKTKDMSQSELILFIFFNNIKSSFFGMVFGVFLGILPIINSILNGYLLGYVAAQTTNAEGFFSLWRIFPHGIFELPAIFISLGLGLKLGTFLFEKNKMTSLRKFLTESIKVFVFVVFPLLVIAAIIEGALIFLFK